MGNDTMDVGELAIYLQRDVREVTKMASRGTLPGRKVSGEWRFIRVEINQWIETQMHAYTEKELSALDRSGDLEHQPLLTELLSEASIAVPMLASTRASVLRELVRLAEQSYQVYDPDALLSAIRQREELGTTTLAVGVAMPHPHRPLPSALGESVVAFGRTLSPIPFGGREGTDLFFLVACRDDRTHLRVLARLSRLILRTGFLEELRATESTSEAYELILREEHELITF